MTIPTLDQIVLGSLVIVIGMIVAAQRYVANKRLANGRRNPED
jgi:hypothetical protein